MPEDQYRSRSSVPQNTPTHEKWKHLAADARPSLPHNITQETKELAATIFWGASIRSLLGMHDRVKRATKTRSYYASELTRIAKSSTISPDDLPLLQQYVSQEKHFGLKILAKYLLNQAKRNEPPSTEDLVHLKQSIQQTNFMDYAALAHRLIVTWIELYGSQAALGLEPRLITAYISNMVETANDLIKIGGETLRRDLQLFIHDLWTEFHQGVLSSDVDKQFALGIEKVAQTLQFTLPKAAAVQSSVAAQNVAPSAALFRQPAAPLPPPLPEANTPRKNYRP